MVSTRYTLVVLDGLAAFYSNAALSSFSPARSDAPFGVVRICTFKAYTHTFNYCEHGSLVQSFSER